MSARMQTNRHLHQIIIKGFELLKFKPIFERYDKYASTGSELLGAITHTNELAQLRDNSYYPQTATATSLQTNYGAIFEKISENTLNLERNKDETAVVLALKTQLAQLELDKQYLSDHIFSLSEDGNPDTTPASLKKMTHIEFLVAKAKLKRAISRYCRTMAQ